MTKTFLAAGMMAAFFCSVGNAQIRYTNTLAGATLIYSNAFGGGAAVSLNNTPPDYAVSRYGGTNTAVWLDVGGNTNGFSYFANGTLNWLVGDSILLPFTPQSNQVYTLTASVYFTAYPGNWIASGYTQKYVVLGTNAAAFNSSINAYDWALFQESSTNAEYFAGNAGNINIFNQNNAAAVNLGSHTFTYILDTTSNKTTIAGFIDGVQMGTNYTFAANPTIAGIGVGQHALTAPSKYQWLSLGLSAAQLVIVEQPASGAVNAGSAFTNTVVAAGTPPFSYQWYTNGSAISGATNASLIINPATASSAGTNYYVVVTNSAYGAVTSSPASLTVYAAPAFISQLPATYTNLYSLYAGVSPRFSVAAGGKQPISYQWYTNGVVCLGQTNTNFTWVNVAAGMITNYCVASNSVGATTNTPWVASVLPVPATPYPAYLLSLNPVGYWRLNEAEVDNSGDDGVVALDYAAGNDCLYTNAYLGNSGYSPSTDPSVTSADFGSIASSDSGAFAIQGIGFAAPSNTSATFSIEAWAYGLSSEVNGAGIVSKGYGGAEQFVLGVTNNGYQFFVRDASGNFYSVATAIGPNSTWQHIVGVYDEANSILSLYVNGVLVATSPITPGIGLLSSSNAMTIGARSSTPTANNDLQFKGFVNDVAVFTNALSMNQIVSEYSTVAGVSPYFLQKPPTSITMNSGGPLTLPAIASGSMPIGYYWTEVNSNTTVAGGSTNGLPLNAALMVSDVPGGWNNDQLEVTVTNAYGSTNILIPLTVYGSVAITRDLPTQLSVVSGASYVYSIGVNGQLPYAYQWYNAGTNIAGQTNSTYTATAGAPGSHTTYSVVITNALGAVTSSISTLTSISQLTNALAAGLLQLNPAGYWPMHEVEPASPGDIETNYGTLGLLGTAYYPDWVADYADFSRQVPGAIVGDPDTALHFNYNVGTLANGAGTWTNELYIPHNSPFSTLNPPFSVESWVYYSTNSPGGVANQSIWGQHGWEGLNAGYAGSGTGTNISGMQLAYNSGGNGTLTIYGYSAGVQNIIAQYATVPINNWYHVVVTCDSSTNFQLFVNGTLQASGAGAGLYVPDYWTPLTIGGTRGGTRSSCVTVDEFAVYTNVLADASTHYSDGVSGVAGAYFHDVTNDNAVIYLRMDAPPYTAPNVASWPELLNYGPVGNPGVYTPGTMPGIVDGPSTNGSNFVGLSGTKVPGFSGISSFADAGFTSAFNPVGSNANFTVTAIFRGNPCDNRVQSIVSHGTNSWQLTVSTNGCLVFNAGNGNTATGGTGQNPGDMRTARVYNDGNWHQVAAVNSSNVISIYVDGVLDTNGTPAGITPASLIPGNPGDVMIGSDPNYTNNPTGVGRQFSGQVCEAAFLNQAITATEAQQLYTWAVSGNNSSINYTPTNILYSVAGNLLTLSWPADHTGWFLQAQTNSLGTNWVDLPGSSSTNLVTIPMNPINGSVFYRMMIHRPY